MIKKFSLQNKIFIYYSFITIIVIVVLSVFFYYYIENTLQQKTVDNIEQYVERVSSELDLTIREMDTVSTQVVFNKTLQDIMSSALKYENSSTNYFDIYYSDTREANNILISINSPKVIARRISIFNERNSFISVGNVSYDYDTIKKCLNNLNHHEGFNNATQLNGKWLLLPPHKDDWIKPDEAPLVISLVRTLNATYTTYNTLGIIEVQQPYSIIQKICDEKNNNYRIIIFDDKKQVIFPFNELSQTEINYYYSIVSNKSDGKGLFNNKYVNSEELIYYKYSPNTRWNILALQSKKSLMSPIHLLLKIVIITALALIAITIYFVYYTANSLSAPLKKLRNSVNTVSLDNLSLDANENITNDEVLLLQQAFDSMLKHLKESIDRTMQARVSEIHAHFLALQAQINPHFIYNTISGISAVAHENGNNEIVSMCSHLSNMLRYTGSFNDSFVTLKDELKHTENYLTLYKWRYEERLNYCFDIDNSMYSIEVPKLIIQPIIENCITHGFKNVRPPWKISIKGRADSEYWNVEIIDNGCGFTREALNTIFQKLEEYEDIILSEETIEHINLGGLGLINIFTRLKLLYGGKAIFNIMNNSAKGTTVVIGGLLNSTEGA
jgi:two-component system, sensor histidine kinase YesM